MFPRPTNKRLLALNALIIAAFALSACASASATTTASNQPNATAPISASKSIRISIWHQWSGDYLKPIEQAFKDYEAAHPGVTIDLSRPDDVSSALKVAIPAGQGPDIIGWANDRIGINALVGNIVALDGYGIDQAFLERTYEPVAVKGVIWQGRVWALPETQEGIALVYNKRLVADRYLPADPSNFDDLLAKARAFKADTGKELLCNQGFPGNDAYHIAPVYFGFGVPQFVDDQGRVTVNPPEALKAARWMQDIQKVSPREETYDICQAALAEGQVGMWWTGPWAIANIEKVGLEYGIVPMGKPFVGIKTLMLSQNSVDRGTAEVALDIMKYFTSAGVQMRLALANKTIPAQTAAVNAHEIKAMPTLAGFGAALRQGVPLANTPFADAQWQPLGDATAAIWNGSQQPEEALDTAQRAIEDAIAKMK